MPNSVLWICLVAVWLFVLVPMVIKGRPQTKKTTEVAKRPVSSIVVAPEPAAPGGGARPVHTRTIRATSPNARPLVARRPRFSTPRTTTP